MDAFELLKSDHKKVSQLFKEIESATGKAKRQVFARLKSELDVHAHIEEKILYPALKNTKEAREITLESYEEHKVVKDLLAELANDAVPNDEWDAKLTVLKENVEHHVGEEEDELFGKARKALSSEELDRIGAEMEAEKAAQPGGKVEMKGASSTAKRRSTKATKASSKTKSSESESPGVLKRIANFIGLGDNSTPSGKKPKKASKTSTAKTGKAATKKKSAAGSRASSGSKTSKEKAGGPAPKSARKTAAKKPATKAKSASKKRPASKSRAASTTANTSRANKRAPSPGKRGGSRKGVKSAGSKKGNSRTSTKRGRTR